MGKKVNYWLLPYYIILNWIFDYRKRKAIRDAEKRSQETGRKTFVVQFNRQFYSGTREELRRYNKAGRKLVKRVSGSHLLDFDYRTAIVYTAGQ